MEKPIGHRVTAAGILLMLRSAETPQFLLMRHSDRWDLPKGHCENGETFRQTALRETEEETGISRDRIELDPDFFFDLRYPVQYSKWGDRTFEKQVRYFLGYVDAKPRLQLTEHESAQWYDWQPPHRIQSQTIDPLLASITNHLRRLEMGDESNG